MFNIKKYKNQKVFFFQKGFKTLAASYNDLLLNFDVR